MMEWEEDMVDVKEYRELERPYELWLCSFPDMGNGQILRLVELFGDAKGVYFADTDSWRQVLTEKQVERLKQFTKEWEPESEYGKLQEQKIRLVTLADGEYPDRLRNIPDPPYGLFVKGSLPDKQELTVAVVGARDCSQYGSFVAEKLGETLGQYGITVISGMARGVDGISQQAALNAGGRSCGVLGCGIDICYPKENRKLYDRLPEQGSLISSYPVGTPALARNFPPRNRIVSGLADAVVVVEAREKSGTLITVDMALEQGREVYAVPGRITDRLSDGCNRLIRQGASLLLNPEELIRELYGLRERVSVSKDHGKVRPQLSPELKAVFDALGFDPSTTEEIRTRLSEEWKEINLSTCLMRLCMENLAVQFSPGCFCGKF